MTGLASGNRAAIGPSTSSASPSATARRSSGWSRAVRDAETAAEVQISQRSGQVLGEVRHEVDGAPLRLRDDVRLQILRTREHMESEDVHRVAGAREDVRYLFGIDPELLRPAAHAHTRALDGEIGIDAHRGERAHPELPRRRGDARELRRRLDLDDDAGCDSLPDLRGGLPGSGEADPIGTDAGVQRVLHLARRGDVDAVDATREVLHEGGHGIRLHGVAELDTRGQKAAQFVDSGVEQRPVVREERCLSDARRHAAQRLAAEAELAVDRAEAGRVFVRSHADTSRTMRGRSNLPFGDRGSSEQITTREGSM